MSRKVFASFGLLVMAALILGLSSRAPASMTFVGAVGLFLVDEVTVVYPAASGRNVETNRASARSRAGFLESAHGLPAAVAADDAVTPEQLQGHLFLLGWDNALLGTSPSTVPFRVDGAGRLFLDRIRVEPGEDLLFVAPSPFADGKLLFFWSRIDPELDRMMVVPSIASDWAVVEDFVAVHQGMFAAGSSWPPEFSPMAEKERRAEVAPPPVTRRSPHYRLRFAGAPPSTAEATAILDARERALVAAAERLEFELPEGFSVDLFVYPDVEVMEDRTGVPNPVHAIPRKRELHMVNRFARSNNPHEEIALLARVRFGPCYLTAFCSGLPLAVTDPKEGGELPVYAASLMDGDALPALERLLVEASFLRMTQSGTGFISAGLLVQWIESIGGLDLLDTVYSREQLGVDDLAAALGMEESHCEEAFHAWIRRRGAEAKPEYEFRKAEAEARRLREAGDSAGEAKALAKALRYRPDDAKTMYKLALAQLETDSPKRARSTLRRLVELEFGPGESRYLIFGHYQLGQAWEALGKPDDAATAYRKMLTLPDEFDAHRMANEALQALEAGS